MSFRLHAFLQPAVLAALALGLPSGARAQVQVSDVFYSATSNGTNVTNSRITSANDTNAVSSIATTQGSYVFSNVAGASVNFRRSSASNNNTTAFYQYSSYSSSGSGSATVYSKADSSPTAGEVMLSNDLTQGIRNPFANLTGGSAGATSSNIERIDFSLPNLTVTNVNDGFVFFDLENSGSLGDGFRIAAYTATGNVTVNGTVHANAPTVYANSGLLVAADSFGPTLDTPTGTDAMYIRSSTSSGDNLDVSQSLTPIDTSSGGTINGNDLVLVGILVRFSDLGLSVGSVIQGYSLIASDSVVATATDLINWGNSSVYLTNTDNNTSAGNMDFMGFGAQISRHVPEPATYGLMISGGACALAVWRRWRAKPTG